jgi:hypothetical protein
MNPCSYANLIFDKVAQNIWWRNLFSKCFLGDNMSTCRKLELRCMSFILYKY